MGFALVNLFVELLAVLHLLGLLGRSHWSLLEHVGRVELVTAGHLLAVPDVSYGQIEGCHFLAILSVLPVPDLEKMGEMCESNSATRINTCYYVLLHNACV